MTDFLAVSKSFPKSPGVYLMKNEKGVIVYIGKAKNLRARVGSYFRKAADERYQVRFLLKQIHSIEFVVTDTEKEALLLEHTLIQKHKPKYNIFLKDDKTFVRIRVGTHHPYPDITVTRRVAKDGARYFGPYLSSTAARDLVDQLVRWFQLRTCSDREFSNRSRPCIQYQIKRCSAPCVDYLSKEAYGEQVERVVKFLQGDMREVMNELRRKMQALSEKMSFEEAARIRDTMNDITTSLEKQKMVLKQGVDQDVIGWSESKGWIGIQVFAVRDGKLSAARQFNFQIMEDPEQSVLEFLVQYYQSMEHHAPLILVSRILSGMTDLAANMTQKEAHAIRFYCPKRGEKRKLLELAQTNALERLEMAITRHDSKEAILEKIGQKLHLPVTPKVIECVDISNIMGKMAYGALVTFKEGTPWKPRYRLFSIRGAKQPDDYRMMHETLTRRFEHEEWSFPDLLLIDGGKGQLQVACRVLSELNISTLPVAAIAKGKKEGEEDKIYLPGRKNPLSFARPDSALNLLKAIRDEAHRFGITAHRRRRIREALFPK